MIHLSQYVWLVWGVGIFTHIYVPYIYESYYMWDVVVYPHVMNENVIRHVRCSCVCTCWMGEWQSAFSYTTVSFICIDAGDFIAHLWTWFHMTKSWVHLSRNWLFAEFVWMSLKKRRSALALTSVWEHDCSTCWPDANCKLLEKLLELWLNPPHITLLCWVMLRIHQKKKKLTFFIIVELANFYLFSFVPTNNITNNLPLGVNFWCPYS